MVNVLSSRFVIRPTDMERSLAFYRDVLGLAVYREFATGEGEWGTVFFLGGGFLELSGGSRVRPEPEAVQLWLQVEDATRTQQELSEHGCVIMREPRREPWGLIEMRVSDPDGLVVHIVEVPADHPLRVRRDAVSGGSEGA
ncbi:VOC family protein [Nocardiopsis sp. RSe5-2]|uniref:VOC family protein n=1 Tax=Nocardiopsis endophytica TaxID=3018445 RepID=A0ABT4U7E1_9ACTN|nr:VOC family protein [Nocardiopsis endophytica]MDA2812345.1 VOC family protein [Nocardiopsis endophytica]